MAELWEWPYEPEIDRYGIARVPIPEPMRGYIHRGYRVHLVLPDGSRLRGTVENFNNSAWIARVKVDKDD